ncbi:unnamed protein product, partial [Prorocentrum cordatum]
MHALLQEVLAAPSQEQSKYRESVLTWCDSGLVLQDCVIMCRVAYIHASYIYGFLGLVSVKWERSQRRVELDRSMEPGPQRRPPRTYQLEAAYLAREERAVIESCHALIMDDAAFDGLPLRDRTHVYQTMAFQMLARSACRFHSLVDELSNYPYKLFGTLSNGALASEIADDMKCSKRMDAFSRHFTGCHGGVHAVDAGMELMAIALKARRDQVSIERNHGVLRRFVLGWSPQGMAIDLHGMNAEWISKGIQMQASGLWRQIFNDKQHDAAVDEGGDEDRGGASRGAARKRRLSEWSVFCSEQKRGKSIAEMPTFAQLSTRYADLSPDEFAALTRRAAEANCAVDHGSAAPLGLRRRRAALPDAGAAPGADAGVVAVGGFAALDWDGLMAASRLRRQEAQRARAAEKEELERLRAYDVDASGCLVDRAMAAIGDGARRHAPDVSSSPTSTDCFQHLEFKNKSVQKMTGSILSHSGRHQHARLLRAQLDEVWAAAHSTIQHRPVPDVSSNAANPPTLKTRLCHAANACLCSPLGKAHVAMRAKLHRIVTSQFPKADGQDALLGAEIVLLVVPAPRPAADGGEDVGVGAQPGPGPRPRWFFLADVKLRPFTLFIHEMEASDEGDSADASRRAEGNPGQLALSRARLTSLTTNFTDWTAVREFRADIAWDVCFFRVGYTGELVGTIQARYLDVVALGGGLVHEWWSPSKAKKLSAGQMLASWRAAAEGDDSGD